MNKLASMLSLSKKAGKLVLGFDVVKEALEKKNALNGAKDEISGIAMAIAEKVVERQLNEADQEKLVNQFIDDLGGAL